MSQKGTDTFKVTITWLDQVIIKMFVKQKKLSSSFIKCNNPFQAHNLKREKAKMILAQIALAEESARLRRKEKREKKRMELSKYLGINAWKCDQVNTDTHSQTKTHRLKHWVDRQTDRQVGRETERKTVRKADILIDRKADRPTKTNKCCIFQQLFGCCTLQTLVKIYYSIFFAFFI